MDAREFLKTNYGKKTARKLVEDMNAQGIKTTTGRPITLTWVRGTAHTMGLAAKNKWKKLRTNRETTFRASTTTTSDVGEVAAYILTTRLAPEIKMKVIRALV